LSKQRRNLKGTAAKSTCKHDYLVGTCAKLKIVKETHRETLQMA